MLIACVVSMPRKALFRTSEFPYHVVSRTNNKSFFSVPINQVWGIFINCLEKTQTQYGIQTYHFILLSNHFHWIFKTPNENIDFVMQYTLRESSKKIQWIANTTGHLWGSKYKYTVINSDEYHKHVVKYDYRNSVRARIVRKVQDYKYSTLHAYKKPSLLPIVLHNEDFKQRMMRDENLVYKWLNETFATETETFVQVGLSKIKFTI